MKILLTAAAIGGLAVWLVLVVAIIKIVWSCAFGVMCS